MASEPDLRAVARSLLAVAEHATIWRITSGERVELGALAAGYEPSAATLAPMRSFADRLCRLLARCAAAESN